MNKDMLQYNVGFGAHCCTEALPGALPVGQNSPQVCPYGLYAEQLTGTAFTAPRCKNQRSWLYRIRPSVGHGKFSQTSGPASNLPLDRFVSHPNQYRWDPMPLVDGHAEVDFIHGMVQICGAGDESMKSGLCVYNFAANKSMENTCFYNSDGDFLIVPQHGSLFITTELGKLVVEPCEIVVIPRGIKFSVQVDGPVRGYILEIFKGHFELPGLGPIGANGLANPRDFKIPVAAFEDRDVEFLILNKFNGSYFQAAVDHSPFDVVAWHGNYAPYKYDLRLFNTMNSVSFDHPDPSIYTVLTCQTDEPGVAVADFVIFPPRWMVMEHSFRPPYYHRNIMCEYMGMIYGTYDAKKGGFVPGGSSLHSCMSSHGPDAATFLEASTATLAPHKFEGGLAFMFETCYSMKLHPQAIAEHSGGSAVRYPSLQGQYVDCWRKLPKIFNGSMEPTFPSAPQK